MARIDVDELLGDPDFEDDFNILRSVETVGTNGRAAFVSMQVTCHGVVQPASGRSLQLLPESARVEGALEIWTKDPLKMNDGYHAADIVWWQERSYIVSNVEDFSNYGEGYVRAVCTLHNLVGPSERKNEVDR